MLEDVEKTVDVVQAMLKRCVVVSATVAVRNGLHNCFRGTCLRLCKYIIELETLLSRSGRVGANLISGPFIELGS